ncbi:MAG: AbrB/MazE/SpoVT family DNA-binding domain-containing protein [archaeon]|nr:AbrB/MazE/SpoVT family DNA-binding domain-containing protein [archaeon]
MTDRIEMATVSSRGQICIPNNIRDEMGIKEGSKVLFALTGDSLIMKKVSIETFREITMPLKEAVNKSELKESDIPKIVHRFRAEKRAKR